MDRLSNIDIPCVADPRGNLSFVQHPGALPFTPGEVRWYYDIPADGVDGFQTCKDRNRIVVALSGAVDIDIDGQSARLDRAYRGVFVPASKTARFRNFVTNSVIMVITSGTVADTESVADSHSTSTLDDVRIVDLGREAFGCGSSSGVVNGGGFDVRRVFYLYDVPADSERGGHSHYQARELIVAAAGAFDVVLDDGKERRTHHLDRPYRALYVPRGLWRELNRFSGGAVCLVLTTELFDEADYVRDYDKFINLTASKRQ